MNNKNTQMITKLMFRLLPVQAVLAAIGSINGIVSGFSQPIMSESTP
jgi:hypothetical protein